MPTRLLRDFTDSYRLASVSAEAERLFVRLIQKADDYGRFHADPRLLKGQCLPLHDNVRTTDISRWLAECEKAGLIAVYDAKGRKYLAIIEFGQQARSKSKFPPPPGQADDWMPLFDGALPPAGAKQMQAESEKEKTTENNCKQLISNAHLGGGVCGGASEGAFCVEPDKAGVHAGRDAGTVVLTFPCLKKDETWALYQEKLEEYRKTFPAVDVASECRIAWQWIQDNPSKRKTHRGMPRFLYGWLERCQNRGGSPSRGGGVVAVRQPSPTFFGEYHPPTCNDSPLPPDVLAEIFGEDGQDDSSPPPRRQSPAEGGN